MEFRFESGIGLEEDEERRSSRETNQKRLDETGPSLNRVCVTVTQKCVQVPTVRIWGMKKNEDVQILLTERQ